MTRAPLDREAVLSAAADLADRDGFETISVSALARHLGVQPASLYSHVRDRAAVLDGVHVLALAELAEAIAGETAGRSGRDALAGLAGAHRSFARERPGRWAALQRRAAPETARSAEAARVVSLIWAVLRAYDLAEEELVNATRFVGGAINGFLALEQGGAYDHRDTASDLSWERAVDALDRALATWPGATS
jgi:AcrR family transcriptional regulator